MMAIKKYKFQLIKTGVAVSIVALTGGSGAGIALILETGVAIELASAAVGAVGGLWLYKIVQNWWNPANKKEQEIILTDETRRYIQEQIQLQTSAQFHMLLTQYLPNFEDKIQKSIHLKTTELSEEIDRKIEHSFQRYADALENKILAKFEECIKDGVKNELTNDPIQNYIRLHYSSKLQKSEEIIALEANTATKFFYAELEKYLGAKFISAILLAIGMIQRAQTKTDFLGKVGGTAAQSLPLVGNAIGFLTEEGVSGIKDVVQDEKYENAMTNLSHFKKTLDLAELTARRLTQLYANDLQNANLSQEELSRLAKKCSKEMYRYIKAQTLPNVEQLSLTDKSNLLVAHVKQQIPEVKNLDNNSKLTTVFSSILQRKSSITERQNKLLVTINEILKKYKNAELVISNKGNEFYLKFNINNKTLSLSKGKQKDLHQRLQKLCGDFGSTVEFDNKFQTFTVKTQTDEKTISVDRLLKNIMQSVKQPTLKQTNNSPVAIRQVA